MTVRKLLRILIARAWGVLGELICISDMANEFFFQNTTVLQTFEFGDQLTVQYPDLPTSQD